MYCETCQTDVAAEISPSGQALLCTTCGSEVKLTQAPSLSPEAQSARDLLDRWSQDEMLDPYGPVEASGDGQRTSDDDADSPAESEASGTSPKRRVDASSSGPPEPASKRKAKANHKRRGPKPGRSQPHFRVDAGHQTPPEDVAAELQAELDAEAENTLAADDASPASGSTTPPLSGPHRRPATPSPLRGSSAADEFAALPPGYRVDASHPSVPAPHLPAEVFGTPSGPRPGRFESLAGQLLAYGGVALLTIGTAFVLFGYFGGPEHAGHTATGWLVATIGQMLLFLGVVTLISGGMQQTTHEVGSRVQYLGERLIRLESHTREPLRGPHFARDTVATHGRSEASERLSD